MELIRATVQELKAAEELYRNIIAKTADLNQFARWQWNLHPSEEMIEEYMRTGAMYLFMDGGKTAGAMAVTMAQGSDYHGVAWAVPAADDETAVIHILGVAPEYQGRGIGKQMIDQAMELARASGKKALRLDTLASNTPAQHLYQEKGFTYRGKRNLYAGNTGWTDFFFYEYAL
jgi:ribosomal protein S18 acetylase RimI-like enzyme